MRSTRFKSTISEFLSPQRFCESCAQTCGTIMDQILKTKGVIVDSWESCCSRNTFGSNNFLNCNIKWAMLSRPWKGFIPIYFFPFSIEPSKAIFNNKHHHYLSDIFKQCSYMADQVSSRITFKMSLKIVFCTTPLLFLLLPITPSTLSSSEYQYPACFHFQHDP